MMMVLMSLQSGLTIQVETLPISDPITLFVSNWLLQLNMAWSNFVDGGYDIALGYFNLAKNNVQYNNMDTLSLHSAYGDIYTGIGWCNLRLLHAETVKR